MDASALQTFTSPVVLFLVLGLLAAFARSNLAISEALAKGMSLYLMAAIGLKGGVAVSKSGITSWTVTPVNSGKGRDGRWRDERVTGSDKVLSLQSLLRKGPTLWQRSSHLF